MSDGIGSGRRKLEFSELICAHREGLLAHCARMSRFAADSEDLVQETLLRAWRGREGFEGRGGEASLRSWLYRIATNVSLDSQRGRRPRLASVSDVTGTGGPDWQEILPSSDPGPEEVVAARETIEHAFEAMLRLPARQRIVLIMNDVIGLSGRETAARVGGSLPSVNSLLQRARTGLRAELSEAAQPHPSFTGSTWRADPRFPGRSQANGRSRSPNHRPAAR